MNFLIGATLFGIGLMIAYSASLNFTAAGITLLAMTGMWLLASVYWAGVHDGKKNNDL